MSRLNPPSPRQIYDLCVAIEKLPASPEQTAAVTLASSMLAPGIRIDLGWDQEAAQPEPAPVGGEDVELIRVARGAALSPVIERPVRNLLEDLATRLETALADVARLGASPSRYEDLAAIEQLQVQVDHYRTGMIEARAALAAAEQEKEKAVEEEREACRMIAANYALNCVDSAGRFAANTIGERIRARAGRNDAG